MEKKYRLNKYVFIGSDGSMYGVNINGQYKKIPNILKENMDNDLNNIPLVYNGNSVRD